MGSKQSRAAPYTFRRMVTLNAFADGLLRKTMRLARAARGETCAQMLERALARERRSLFALLRSRGECPELLERADYDPARAMPILPPPDASPIDDVGPRE
jgi:hypothetical protein